MMNIEIRDETVFITGYVNAVERYSKPIREKRHGTVKTFIEKIKAGVFGKALERADNVEVLLNHDDTRVLANTKDNTAKLYEDNIGLRAEVTISDQEVVEKAKNHQLSGWSFGFYCNGEESETVNGKESRTITDLTLKEVSILDNTKSPAYYGTMIEARSEDEQPIEIRSDEQLFELRDDILIDELAERIADIIIDRMTEKKRDDDQTEEKQSVDYTLYEERLKNLKEKA